jgi:ABC-type sugar transport system, permease component
MKKGVKAREKYLDIMSYILLCIGLCIWVFPYLWMIFTSLKIPAEIYARAFPTTLTLGNYVSISTELSLYGFNFYKGLLNSLLVAGVCTVSVVLFSLITGYALSRLKFRGRKSIYSFVLLQLFFPGVIFIIPQFLIVIYLGLMNTYFGMMVTFLMGAFGVFLYAQFFRTVPQDLIDAARIDGCSESGVLRRIMVPLSKPVTATVALFTFMSVWNELLWPLLVCKEPGKMVLSVMLAAFTKGGYGADLGVTMAGTTILTLPVIIIFIVFRKYFLGGIVMTTGLK